MTDSAAPVDGPKHLSLLALLLATLLLFTAFGGASRALRLGLERAVAIGACRSALQLSLLGYLLVPIFRINHPLLVLTYATFMACVAAHEATSRVPHTYPALLSHVTAVVLAVAYFVAFWALFVVLRTGIDAHYAIPIVGMLLGNTSSSIAVTLGAVTGALKDSRDSIEVKLAMGATRWEAMAGTIRSAVVLGTTSIINQMNIMGLVSIPGMMTGQILGGTSPSTAARYQIVILFLLASCSILSTTGVSVLVLLSCSDEKHRLRSERLAKRTSGEGGGYLKGALMAAWARVQRGWAALRSRVRRDSLEDPLLRVNVSLMDSARPMH